MKESYLNLLITIALIAYLSSLYAQGDFKSFMEGIAYGVCFGAVVYFLNHMKMFLSKNEQ